MKCGVLSKVNNKTNIALIIDQIIIYKKLHIIQLNLKIEYLKKVMDFILLLKV